LVKLFDEVAGIFMFASLVHAHKIEGSNAIKQMQITIGISFLTLSISDVLGLCLVAVVFYYSRSAIDFDHSVNPDDEEVDSIKNHHEEYSLSLKVIQSPEDFLLIWRSLSCRMISMSRLTDRQLIPRMDYVIDIIEKRHFTVVASGMTDSDVIKIFAFTFIDGIYGLVCIECLNRIRLEFKCKEKKMLTVFYDALCPEAIFGGSFSSEYKS
jgi:hypothetical protein